MISTNILTHSKTITKNAKAGFCKPKKAIDQREFKTRLTTNNIKEFLTKAFLSPSCQIKYKAIPIKIYSVVQTGPNIQEGGLKLGLLRY